MIRNFALFIFLSLATCILCKCTGTGNKKINQAEELFCKGEFRQAEAILNQIRAELKTDSALDAKAEILEAKIARIRIDFSKNEEQVREELKPWFPGVDQKTIDNWEKGKKLEMRHIDGEKRYFRHAVSNLFRIDSLAMKIKERQVDPLAQICLSHTSGILMDEGNNPQTGGKRYQFRIDYSITVQPDVVPDGETIRCWMPYPRSLPLRQKNIRLLQVNDEKYHIAPDSSLQRSLYMEKTAKKGQPVVFLYSAEFETVPVYYLTAGMDIRPYFTRSELFRKYTSERPPHLIFSKEIRQLAASLTDGITDPRKKVRQIFTWIDKNIPWASALEYSIMENIPQYVLENRHGDCGMKTLLFMSLARVSGIPCRWQSGWMLHPGEVNLHDWCEVYYEGVGWVPLDQSFGLQDADEEDIRYFYASGIDAYRMIVNDEYGVRFDPEKKYFRSEPIDFQRGELEWKGGNLYFDKWDYQMDVTYLKN